MRKSFLPTVLLLLSGTLLTIPLLAQQFSLFPDRPSYAPLFWLGSVALLGCAWALWQRRSRDDAVRMIRAEYDNLLEHAGDLFQAVGPDGSMRYANRAWRETLGYDKEEIGGLCFFQLVRPDHRDPCRDFFARLLQGKTSGRLETVLRTKDGRDIQVEGTVAFRFEGGKAHESLGAFRNVTVARDTETHLQSMVENSVLGMVKAAPDGSILQANGVFCEFIGYRRKELLKLTLAEVTSPEKREKTREAFHRAATGTERVFDYENKFLRKDGTTVWGHITLTWMGGEKKLPSYCLAWIQDVTQRKRDERRVNQLAYFDGLTGLPNRTLFFDRLTQAIAQSQRNGSRLGLLFLDLDQFKRINDTLGHAIGDRLLKHVAKRLKRCVRKSDTVARLGGDEFVFLLPEIKNERNATLVAQSILRSLAVPHQVDDRELHCSGSIGIALYPEDGTDAATLLKNGDMAMYEAKARGRNTCLFFSEEMNRKAIERLDLETKLRTAVRDDEFFIVYQPQVDLRTSRVVGVEALVRWRHPERGLIGPDKFIPVAEETGLILPIGHWILHTACTQFKAWREAGLPLLRVAVNLSGLQLGHPNFISQVEEILEKTGLPPQCLELELTENIFMKNIQETIMDLTDLKVLGVNLAIDDFGTGYSSLSYLKNFLVDRVKIAQEFVRDISSDKGNAAIVETIVAMAHNLNLNVIAEGVETREQMEFLRARNCYEMQGYYFGTPMEAEEFSLWLENGHFEAVGF